MVEFGNARGRDDSDFTPWVSENLDLLSEVIGVPFELGEQEENVAEHLVDIVARIPISDDPNENLVVIVNQLGQSDLTQLGQILACLSVHPANTAIWITEEFAQTHQQAIRWLNAQTPADFAFFAVKIGATQNRESSQDASVFRILEQPENWGVRTQVIQTAINARGKGLNENSARLQAFWQQYAQKYPEELVGHAPNFKGQNLFHKIIDGIHVCQVFGSSGWVAVYLARNGRWGSELTAEFSQVLRNALTLEWGGSVAGGTALHIDVRNPANWPEMIDWMHERLGDFRRVILEHARETGLIE